jgi:hypothetical protein
MEEKWHREIKFLTIMSRHYPQHVPTIDTVDHINKKIYFDIDGADFWELSGCNKNNFDSVLPNWREQMLDILKSHQNLGIYKYSLHPSSYFIVNGKLKSINYFFAYDGNDKPISLKSVLSHISENRRNLLFPQMEQMGINLYMSTEFKVIQKLAYRSFATDYPEGLFDELL